MPDIVDRLPFGGHIIETGTDPYRLALSRAQHARTVEVADLLPSS